MYRDVLEKPLAELGLTPDNFHALRVLPLLYVAWSNGRLADTERALILRICRERLQLDANAMGLVHHWLSGPPANALIQRGVACLRRAAAAVDQPDFGHDDLLQTLWDAEHLARRVAILSGRPYQPSERQHQALLELAEMMRLDSGTPWLNLLVELGGQEEAARTLPSSAQQPARRSTGSDRSDRARRWRAAFRLHGSHSHRLHPPGGLI